MTRNLRTQLADLAEQYLRLGRTHVSRERAVELLADWPLAQPWDDETMALVLDRFAPAEPPNVPGMDWLPGVDWSQYGPCACGAAPGHPCVQKRQERTRPHGQRPMMSRPAVAAPAEPKAPRKFLDNVEDRWLEQPDGKFMLLGVGSGPTPFRMSLDDLRAEYGPLVEVVPQPNDVLADRDEDALTECTCQVSNNPPCAWCENDGGAS